MPVRLGTVGSYRSRRITVEVTGARSGEGPVTWGQWAIRSAMREVEPHHHVFNMCLTGLLDRPVRLDTALGAVRGLLVLHDSLRTRIVEGPGGMLRQRLDGAGGLETHHFEAEGPDAVAAVEAAVEATWTAVSFDHERDWPLRVALIGAGAGDEVAQVVLVLSHTASDAMGLQLLRGDFAALLDGAGPARLRARRGFQPLDEAAYQASARGRRRDEAARRYWRAGLAAAPARVFAPGGAGPRTFRRATLVSPALPPALDTLAERWHMPSAAVLLAAVSAAVARESGRGQGVLQVMVSNRFIPSLRSILSPVTLEGLFILDADAASFEALARRAWEASVRTYYHSYYDKAALNEDIDRVVSGRGGRGADRTCWFNDLRDLTPEAYPSWAQRRARLGAPCESSVEWSAPVDDQGEVSVAWHVYRRFDWLPVVLTLNTTLLDQAAGERMLADVEGSIVDAAHHRRGRP